MSRIQIAHILQRKSATFRPKEMRIERMHQDGKLWITCHEVRQPHDMVPMCVCEKHSNGGQSPLPDNRGQPSPVVPWIHYPCMHPVMQNIAVRSVWTYSQHLDKHNYSLLE